MYNHCFQQGTEERIYSYNQDATRNSTAVTDRVPDPAGIAVVNAIGTVLSEANLLGEAMTINEQSHQ